MTTPQKNKRKLKRKLTDKYKLVVLNQNTNEERFSLRLSLLNVFALGGLFAFLLIIATTVLIAFSPLKEYIPGYASADLNRQIAELTFETDSLKKELMVLKNYADLIKPVLTGEIAPEEIDSIQVEPMDVDIDEDDLYADRADSLFRERVEEETRFAIERNANSNVKIVFFAPLKGTITDSFDASARHFAVDISAKSGTPIKAVADGTVIFSGYTLETGYSLILKHTSNYVSVYKHNGNLLKQEGDFVKSGEVIASVGSTGELTTGPHLHFELWSGGYAVNPLNLIDFEE